MAIAGSKSRGISFWSRQSFVFGVLVLFTLYTITPLFYLAISSTKSTGDLFTTFGLWFSDEIFLTENLEELFMRQNGAFLLWWWNTLWYSGTSAFLSTVTAALCGYALAKYRFAGRQFISALILGAVMVPGTALVIPLFLMLSGLGMANSPWSVILPSAIFPLGVFLMRIYSERGVPDELIDAARVDGAGELKIFLSISMRLVAPGLVTVFLLSFVSAWNNYFLPLVMLRSPEFMPLSVGLTIWYDQAVQGQSGTQNLYSVIMAGTLISLVPIIIVFVIMQRFWQEGLTLGSVK